MPIDRLKQIATRGWGNPILASVAGVGGHCIVALVSAKGSPEPREDL